MKLKLSTLLQLSLISLGFAASVPALQFFRGMLGNVVEEIINLTTSLKVDNKFIKYYNKCHSDIIYCIE